MKRRKSAFDALVHVGGWRNCRNCPSRVWEAEMYRVSNPDIARYRLSGGRSQYFDYLEDCQPGWGLLPC